MGVSMKVVETSGEFVKASMDEIEASVEAVEVLRVRAGFHGCGFGHVEAVEE